MKKILVGIILSLFALNTASAEVGLKVGVAGSAGLFAGTAKEAQTGNGAADPTENRKRSELLGIGYASIFVEKSIGDRFSVGVDYVPTAIESETTETTRNHITTAYEEVRTKVENKVQVDFTDLTTLYANINLTENLYAKIGVANVTVETNENLGTGAAYGDTDMDATVLGFGYDNVMDNGVFVRLEANYMDFDGVSLTSGDNTISVTSLHGVSGKLAIGRAF